MADLITKLAQQIIGLINSQVRSPTKDEIENVLKPVFELERNQRRYWCESCGSSVPKEKLERIGFEKGWFVVCETCAPHFRLLTPMSLVSHRSWKNDN